MAAQVPSQHFVGVAEGQLMTQRSEDVAHTPLSHLYGVSVGQGHLSSESAQLLSGHFTCVLLQVTLHAAPCITHVPSLHRVGVSGLQSHSDAFDLHDESQHCTSFDEHVVQRFVDVAQVLPPGHGP